MASKEELKSFVNDKIGHYADILVKLTKDEQTGESALNQHALGELEFYCNLSVALEEGVSKDAPVVAGILDGINDLLQDIGLVNDGTTFYSTESGIGGTKNDVQENEISGTLVSHVDKLLETVLQQSTNNKGVGTRIFEQAKIGFYVAVKNCVNRVARPCDVGMIDAVNDTLQFLGFLSSKQRFYNL